MKAPERALEAVFMAVAARGVPIGPRDYMDALISLGRGFGVLTRERLLGLCLVLWARSEEEAVIVSRVFQEISPPESQQVAAITGRATRRLASARTAPGASPRSAVERARAEEARAKVRIAAGDADGVALPAADTSDALAIPFVLSRHPLLTRRQMTVCWRRFRALAREGARKELDVPATVERQCRGGRLDAPVLRAPRRNRARLVVAIDVSPSMVAWRPLCEDLVASLEGSRLGAYHVYFFDNVPGAAGFYRTAGREGLVTAEQVLKESGGSAALIVSDAGAARGRRVAERADQSADFLRRARHAWSCITWLNPMPRARWSGTTAELVAADRHVAAFPFDREGLARAVDVLRGNRAS